MLRLALSKERGAFLVGRGRPSPGDVSASPGGHCNKDSHDKQESHDDEGEDPLEGDDLAQELGDTNRGSEHTERESHGIVLVDGDEEQAIGKESPDENIAEDAGDQVVWVRNHQRTIPVQSHKGPCQRDRADGRVDEARVCVVAEVQRRQVEEVEHQDDFSPVEVGLDEEQDEAEVEEVVHDEVASHAGGGMDDVGVAREEVADVASLEDEENDPIDLSNDGIHGESSWVQVVDVPDASSDAVAIVRFVNGVVDRDDDGEEPGEEGEDLEGDDGAVGMGIPLAEGVVLVPVRHDGRFSAVPDSAVLFCVVFVFRFE